MFRGEWKNHFDEDELEQNRYSSIYFSCIEDENYHMQYSVEYPHCKEVFAEYLTERDDGITHVVIEYCNILNKKHTIENVTTLLNDIHGIFGLNELNWYTHPKLDNILIIEVDEFWKTYLTGTLLALILKAGIYHDPTTTPKDWIENSYLVVNDNERQHLEKASEWLLKWFEEGKIEVELNHYGLIEWCNNHSVNQTESSNTERNNPARNPIGIESSNSDWVTFETPTRNPNISYTFDPPQVGTARRLTNWASSGTIADDTSIETPPTSNNGARFVINHATVYTLGESIPQLEFNVIGGRGFSGPLTGNIFELQYTELLDIYQMFNNRNTRMVLDLPAYVDKIVSQWFTQTSTGREYRYYIRNGERTINYEVRESEE